MSSAPARVAKAKGVLTDADLHYLFGASGLHPCKNAILLLTQLKALNRECKPTFVIRDSVLATKLGWSKSTVKRTKRAIREAGIPVEGVRDRRGVEWTATRWTVYRPWIVALRDDLAVQADPQVGSEVTRPYKGLENLRASRAASLSSRGPESATRAPPRASPQERALTAEAGLTMAEHSVGQPLAPPMPAATARVADQAEQGPPPPETFAVQLAELRGWLRRRRDLGTEMEPADFAALLLQAERELRPAGPDRFAMMLARRELEREYRSRGIGADLSLVDRLDGS